MHSLHIQVHNQFEIARHRQAVKQVSPCSVGWVVGNIDELGNSSYGLGSMQGGWEDLELEFPAFAHQGRVGGDRRDLPPGMGGRYSWVGGNLTPLGNYDSRPPEP